MLLWLGSGRAVSLGMLHCRSQEPFFLVLTQGDLLKEVGQFETSRICKNQTQHRWEKQPILSTPVLAKTGLQSPPATRHYGAGAQPQSWQPAALPCAARGASPVHWRISQAGTRPHTWTRCRGIWGVRLVAVHRLQHWRPAGRAWHACPWIWLSASARS